MSRDDGPRAAIAVFTRDLRVHDNPVLDAACRSAERVVPLFVLDPDIGAFAVPNRLHFLHGCLHDLREQLRGRGSDLVLRRGHLVAEVIGLARRCGADSVVVAAEHSDFGQRRQRDLERECRAHRLALHVVTSSTVVRPGQLTPAGGGHYKVFTPYWRAWSAAVWRDGVPTPRRIQLPAGVDAGTLPGRAELTAGRVTADLPEGGESAARRRMFAWLRGGLAGYPAHHDDLAADGTSRLSADLHFGTLSSRELAVRARAADGGEEYVRQLCWRDFHAQVTAAFPAMARRDYRHRDRRWHDDPDALDAWRAGQTGYPVVDAGMRQLMAEGFMHNRARLLVASFLTRRLAVHWTAGAAHFFDLLVDGDIANNAGNWQWVAGTGNDTRPNRRFNLLRQARRFDPAGGYVRRYVPELSAVTGSRVHEPWKLEHGVRYPAPLVPPE